MAKSIIESVGRLGKNLGPDTLTVQQLLNGVSESLGGPKPKLDRAVCAVPENPDGLDAGSVRTVPPPTDAGPASEGAGAVPRLPPIPPTTAGESMAHVGVCPVPVVGQRLDVERHATGPVSLVGDLVVSGVAGLA